MDQPSQQDQVIASEQFLHPWIFSDNIERGENQWLICYTTNRNIQEASDLYISSSQFHGLKEDTFWLAWNHLELYTFLPFALI